MQAEISRTPPFLIAAFAAHQPAAKPRFYRPELELLRFVAFLMVFMSHVIPVHEGSPHLLVALKASGKLGVPLFFMLSAYLITELLLRERAATGSLNARAFYIRRMLRIWPLYFFALFTGFFFLHLVPHQKMPIAELIACVFMAGNWYSAFFGAFPPGMGPLWSISVEEQFYLLWPSVIRTANERGIWVAAMAAWLLSQIAIVALCLLHAPIWFAVWTNSMTHLQYFGLGAMVSLALKHKRLIIGPTLKRAAILLGAALLLAANYYFDTTTNSGTASLGRTYPGYLITGIGAALLLLGTIGVRVSRLLDPAVWLGKVSYGLYVYHMPCVLFSVVVCAKLFHIRTPSDPQLYLFVFAAGLPLTIATSVLSYRYLEAPFLRLKERFTIVRSRAV
jgi:peptidoglycan/LPS O-acetylase OafA/YrhL